MNIFEVTILENNKLCFGIGLTESKLTLHEKLLVNYIEKKTNRCFKSLGSILRIKILYTDHFVHYSL